MTADTVAPSLARPLMVFAVALIGFQAALLAIGYAFPDLNMPSGMSMVVTMIAGMFGGQSFARASGRVMSGAEKLRFALAGTVLAMGLGAATMAALFAWHGVPFTLDALAYVMGGEAGVAPVLRDWLWVILGVAALATLGLVYLGAGMGAKAVVRQMEKQAGRR